MLESVTGAQALSAALTQTGVGAVFTTPGGARLQEPGNSPVSGPAMIELPHGQDTGHSASGYAKAGGRTGVCLASPGSGTTELLQRDQSRRSLRGDRFRRGPGGNGLANGSARSIGQRYPDRSPPHTRLDRAH
ncbi:thiamine pyrophosphate-binding protein [Streptomyces sp. NPDC047860]|uniref:thiamine pyrophosphate-binding protein n=1 Tax=Streptomyces sp. NPDC047860 TaxID=3155743 RepID=UPI0033D40795